MADDGTLAEVREALDSSERVNADDIELSVDDDAVVLDGQVASEEEASVAEMVAAQHAATVRNELRVDPNVREDATGTDLDAANEGTQPDTEPELASELSVQTGGFQPERPGDLVTDAQEALGENVPLDPPDEPHS